jgi:hypothetical protein
MYLRRITAGNIGSEIPTGRLQNWIIIARLITQKMALENNIKA